METGALNHILRSGNDVMNELISLDFTIDVTFVPYSVFRDVQRASSLPWHKDYTRTSAT